MAKLFENMMTGLDEVDAFLTGETAGCKERPRNGDHATKTPNAKGKNAGTHTQPAASKQGKNLRPAKR